MAAATVAPVGMYVSPLISERRALDRVAPAVVEEPGLTEPAAPVADRRLEACVRLVDVLGNSAALCPESARKAWSPCAS